MLTSAGGILALLQDNPDVKQGVSSDEEIKLKVQLTQFALRKLDLVVDEFWAEISDSIQIIEVRRENDVTDCHDCFVVSARWCTRTRCTQQR